MYFFAITGNICANALVIKSAFLELKNTDPYKALSFDRLHAFHAGLFGKHMWPLLKAHIEKLSSSTAAQVDEQYGLYQILP